MDAEALVRPGIEAEGLEIVEVVLTRESGRKVLRVVVDRDGGVDLDTLSELAQQASRALDAGGFDVGPYALEVSSPGIERPLTRPAHFNRVIGQRVKVRTTAPLAGSTTHRGTLRAADEEAITIATDSGEVRVPHTDVASARTVVDWDAELKRSSA